MTKTPTRVPDPLERQPDRELVEEWHDVGGVRLRRPFKIRRLGHFGYNCVDIDAMLDFYVDGLGLIVSDRSATMPARLPAEIRAELGPNEKMLHFTRFGSEHHQLVFISQRVWDWVGRDNGSAGASINQVTWQVGSLAEVVGGAEWIWGRGERLLRSGRDMPGSNWHTYLFDPEGHINELYYGMEQIGWDGLSKPSQMWSGVFHERPSLPQRSEATEVADAGGSGIDIASGHRAVESTSDGVAVDGVVMRRPFKIVGIGPVSLFVEDLEATKRFYTTVLGFDVRREVEWNGHRGVLLSCGTDHHNLALYEVGLREAIGLGHRNDSMALGFRLANYRQLRAAVAHMVARGAEEVEVPGELVPGFDYVSHLRDPDGNLVQLYYYQRQCAPEDPFPTTVSGGASQWPEVIDAPSDVFGGQQFLGPWQ
ncbi:VOC family protein [Streptomyces prunicolor]|uniref:VOC family protein n=1 Tax=Streptomyces prunicolor TaxID=67348 RepID=UPI0033E90C49